MDLELKIQSDFIIYMWNYYPTTRGMIVQNRNNSKNKIEGAKNKSLGTVTGFPDLTFYWNAKTYFIELKTNGNTLSPEQKKQHKRLISQGFSVETIDCNDKQPIVEYVLNIIKENS